MHTGLLKTTSVVLLFFFLHTLAAQVNTSAQDKIASELKVTFRQGQYADFIVVMRQQSKPVPPSNLKLKHQKAQFVFDRLQETAQNTQANVRRIIREHRATANNLYIVNATAVVQGNEKLALALAELPEVSVIIPDPSIHLAEPLERTPTEVQVRSGVEWGIERIQAPQVWAMGFTGQGVTIGGADTGYDWAHPALQSHYKGYKGTNEKPDHNYNWHDAIHGQSPLNSDANNPCGFNTKHPCDDDRHGTHTMGTMAGDDGQGNQTGVAPGARWIGCRNMERGWGKPSTYIECFEWFLAPTDTNGLNPRPDKAPDVINNSWYCAESEGCTSLSIDSLLHIALVNLRNSGVLVVVSNGNSGRNGCSVTDGPPAYFEESFSIGASDFNEKIADFSTRGPVTKDKSNRIKPNVAAPGVNVRSSIPGGGYANFQGTSMAGPHVVGVAALILSARPDLAGQVDVLEDLIEKTAVPHPDPSGCSPVADAIPNNAFGFGRVDALEAVRAALSYVDVHTAASPALEVRVLPNPTQSEVFFDLTTPSGPVTLKLLSPDGRIVSEQHLSGSGQNAVIAVSLSNYPAGAYYWQATTDKNMAQGIVIKH